MYEYVVGQDSVEMEQPWEVVETKCPKMASGFDFFLSGSYSVFFFPFDVHHTTHSSNIS